MSANCVATVAPVILDNVWKSDGTVAKMVMLDVEVVEVIKSLMEDRYHSEQM